MEEQKASTGDSLSTIVPTSTVSPSFIKLRGRDNYVNWAFSMEMLLIDCDLWECVLSTLPSDANEAVKRRDAKARSKICLSCHENVFPLIVNAKTAYETWHNLKRAYADSGLVRKLTLMKKLLYIKYNSNMESYVNEVMATQQQLQNIHYVVDDEFLAIILLCGLPDRFNPLVMALEHSNTKLTSETVIAALLKEDHHDSARESSSYTSSANDSAFVSSNRNDRDFGKVVCNYCHKRGHLKFQCRLLKSRNSKNDNSRNTESEVVNSCEMLLAGKDFDNHVSSSSNPVSDHIMFVKSDDWYIDSGATRHMTNRNDWLQNVKPLVKNIKIANDDTIISVGIGDVKLESPFNTRIMDVLHVPKISTNLLSVSSLTKQGHTVLFSKYGGKILDGASCKVFGKVLATASNINGMYKLDIPTEQVNVSNTTMDLASLWHKRLGHLNFRSMEVLRLHLALGIQYTKPGESFKDTCIPCMKGKLCKQPFKPSLSRATDLLELIHSDVCGPMSTKSFGDTLYFVTFTDDFSRKTFTYFMKQKSEVKNKFIEFMKLVERQTDKKIKILRSDNGGEYVNNEMQQILKDNGIIHQTTVPYTPQQNGVSERVNRTLVEKARTMLEGSYLPRNFWAEAINTATYLKNRSPTKALWNRTPEEKWTGRKTDLSHLRVFGCNAYAYIPKELRKKLDPKAKLCIFVGYCTETKGYRVVDPYDLKLIWKVRDVKFIENKFFYQPKSPESVDDQSLQRTIETDSDHVYHEINKEAVNHDISVNHDSTETPVLIENTPEEIIEDNEEFHDSTDTISMDIIDSGNNVERRYPLRNRIPKQWSEDILSYKVCEDDEPCTIKEAMSSTNKNKWLEALNNEYDSLMNHETWTLVDRPENRNIVKSKWVFKVKRNADGEITKYKARLVAKGFTQTYGIDYDETFSPVTRLSTIRILFAIAAQWNLVLDQMDVETAFLNGDLDEQIFMEQPQGFVKDSEKGKVCLLRKALYGLKQAPRQWNLKITEAMKQLSFDRSEYDHCLFYKFIGKSFMIVAIFVDDFCILTNDSEIRNWFKENIKKYFKVKDLGPVAHFLGMKITQGDYCVSVDQSEYIKKLLQKFQLADAKPCSTPADSGQKLVCPTPEDKGEVENFPYQQLIGSLMFLAVATRPDISHAVSVLSQFNNNYGKEHCTAAKRVLRYLKGTMHHKLLYHKNQNFELVGYTDADYGACLNDRRSYTGYVFYLNGPVSWESRKQRTVALSTTEAEYMAISDACKEAIYLNNLLREVLDLRSHPTIFSDNQGAQMLVKNNVYHSRTKHIDIRHHFVRELVSKGTIYIKYIPTDKMIADVLTKFLNKTRHLLLTRKLGLS